MTAPNAARRDARVSRTPYRLLRLLIGSLCLMAATGASAAAPAIPAGGLSFDRPGQLVRLADGRHLNLVCTGHGSPTVVFESGFAAGASAWGKVAPMVGRTTRACAYDRAGYGYSDPGPMPRDGAAIARDLDRGLQAAGVKGPLILVGHSAGGLYVRLLAARRLKDVVGMVLVDPSVEHQDRRFAALFGAGAGSVEGIRQRVLKCALATEARPGIAAEREACVAGAAGPHDRAIALRPATWRAQVSEIETLFNATSDQVDRVGDLTKDIPVIVLTASADGQPAGRDNPGAVAWEGLHKELASRFLSSSHRLVKSSHLIMIDRPEVVAAAVEELVGSARAARR